MSRKVVTVKRNLDSYDSADIIILEDVYIIYYWYIYIYIIVTLDKLVSGMACLTRLGKLRIEIALNMTYFVS